MLGTLLLARQCKPAKSAFLLKPRKFLTTLLVRKLMLMIFWNYESYILEHYMPRGTTISIEAYCALLENHFKPTMRSKCCDLLFWCVVTV